MVQDDGGSSFYSWARFCGYCFSQFLEQREIDFCEVLVIQQINGQLNRHKLTEEDANEGLYRPCFSLEKGQCPQDYLHDRCSNASCNDSVSWSEGALVDSRIGLEKIGVDGCRAVKDGAGRGVAGGVMLVGASGRAIGVEIGELVIILIFMSILLSEYS